MNESSGRLDPGTVEQPGVEDLGMKRGWLAEARDLLKAYDEAMANQADNGPDIKLIVMANYGDLCAGLLRRVVAAQS